MREDNVKGKNKSKHKPSSPLKNITQKESESGSSGCSAKDIQEDEEGMDVGEFSSNLEGYPGTKGKIGEGNEEETIENNSD